MSPPAGQLAAEARHADNALTGGADAHRTAGKRGKGAKRITEAVHDGGTVSRETGPGCDCPELAQRIEVLVIVVVGHAHRARELAVVADDEVADEGGIEPLDDEA